MVFIRMFRPSISLHACFHSTIKLSNTSKPSRPRPYMRITSYQAMFKACPTKGSLGGFSKTSLRDNSKEEYSGKISKRIYNFAH